MSLDFVDLLRRHTEADGEAPWLFARVGWDWQWRSWARVADQVARGAAVLDAQEVSGRVALAPGPWRAGPDGVTALLAALHAGLDVELPDAQLPDALAASDTLIAVEGIATGDGIPVACRLPAVRGPLEREPLETLGERLGGRIVQAGRPWSPASLLDETGLDESGLDETGLDDRPVDHRPHLHGRPILATGAWSLPVLVACLAWSLRTGAAWALEPDAAAFADSAAWVRPHVVVADAPSLDALATRLGRRGRRHARLREVVVTPLDPIAHDDSSSGAASAASPELEALAPRLARRPPRIHVLGRSGA